MAGKISCMSVALTTTLTTNILNPPTLTGGVGVPDTATFIIIRRISIINKTGASAKFSLWRGATGANTAGTEVFGIGTAVATNSDFTRYPMMRLSTSDYLVGGSDTATALTLEIEYEIGVA